jgi:hypothetical protein
MKVSHLTRVKPFYQGVQVMVYASIQNAMSYRHAGFLLKPGEPLFVIDRFEDPTGIQNFSFVLSRHGLFWVHTENIDG